VVTQADRDGGKFRVYMPVIGDAGTQTGHRVLEPRVVVRQDRGACVSVFVRACRECGVSVGACGREGSTVQVVSRGVLKKGESANVFRERERERERDHQFITNQNTQNRHAH
jgi:hypothetical protein